MKLDWNLFPISFTQGVDTKTDERQVLPGRLLTLENGVFDTPGKIRKRFGLTTLSREIEGGDSVATGSALAVRRSDLVAFGGGKARVWLPSTERWNPLGDAESVLTRTRRVVENHAAQSSPDVAATRGVELHAWEDSRGGVRGSVFDTANGTPILSDFVVSLTGRQPRCVAHEGALHVLYADSNTIKHRRVDTSAPRTVQAERVLVTDHADSLSSSFDAISVSSNLYVGYGNTSDSTTLARFDASLSLVSDVALSGTHGPVSVWSDPSQNVWLATLTGSAGSLIAHARSRTLATVMTGTLVDADPGDVVNVTGVCVSGTLASVYYEVSGSRAIDQLVKVAPVDTTATVTLVSGSVTSVSQSFSSSLAPSSSMTYRGVNVVGPAWGSNTAAVPARQYPGVGGWWEYWIPPTDELLYFKSKKFNTIRLQFLWERIQPLLNGPLSSSYYVPLNGFINQCLSESMHVVLEPHNFGGRVVSGTNRKIGDGTLTSVHFANLWSKLASMWKHDDRVVFDIMNEPHDLGGSDGGLTWLTASNAAIAAIRATGATNPIFVPGHQWNNSQGFSSDWGEGTKPSDYMGLIVDSGDNWYVTTHNYPENTHGDSTSPISSPTILRTRAQNVVDWCRSNGKRCVFGEYSANASTTYAQDTVEDFLLFCEENSDVVKGWMWWGSGMDYRSVEDPQSTFTESAYSISPVPYASISGSSPTQQAWIDPYLADVETVTTSTFYVTSSAGGSSVVSTAGTPSVWMRSVGLASKAWKQGDTHYLWTAHDSDQATYFAHNANGTIVSKANQWLGGGLRRRLTLSNVATLSDGSRLAAFQRKGSLLSSGTLRTQPGVTATSLTFDANDGYSYATAGDTLHLAGGVLSAYDGVSFAEHGFHLYPEQLSAEATTDGGSMDAGEYQYVALYSWRDNVGQVHRSAVSEALTVTVGGSTTSAVTMSVPTLRLTSKDRRGSQVNVEIYRNERDGGNVFHLVTDPVNPLVSSSSLDAVTFVDGLSDSELTSRALLYTDSGEVDNDPPPASSIVATYANRLWLAGLEDPDVVRYTKPRRAGEPFEFSELLELVVDAQGGPIVAMHAMDDLLIVFKPRAIHAVGGQGRDRLAQGQDPDQRLITTDVGCVNKNTAVMTDKGLFFLSDKGIYLLDRALQVQPIGFPVEGQLEGRTITSATLVSGTNHVRFTTSGGGAVVYDYVAGQWGEFTYPAAVDSVDWNGTYALMRSDGRVSVEDQDSHTDDGALVSLKLETGWLSLNGVQGYQAVRRLYLLGEYLGPGRLRYGLAYDGNPAIVEEGLIDVESIVDSTAYGEGAYGVGDYGGSFPLYQFEIQPRRHRCTAVKLTLEDAAPSSSSPSEALSLGHLTIDVAPIQGGNRLSGRRRVAT